LQFEKTGTGNMVTADLSNRYLWGAAVDELLADEQVDWSDSDADGEVLWALTDHLGSVRDLVDSTGTLQNHKSYDAFGNVMEETNAAVDTLFGFTGKLFDDATGLQNNLNRWYDAVVGRWVSEDPIGFDAGDANLYRYVGNSPTEISDPFGLTAATATWSVTNTAKLGGRLNPLVGAATLPLVLWPAGYRWGQWIDEKTGVGKAIGNWWAPDVSNALPPIQDVPGTPPFQGPPGTIIRGPGQTRLYGPDGYPQTDVDTGHHGAPDPHSHDWGRPPGGGKPTNEHHGLWRPWRPGDPPPPTGSKPPAGE
jgi:RHS repeat-associated protein